MEKMYIELEGYESIQKTVHAGGNSCKIYLPKAWTNKRLKVILLEDVNIKERRGHH